jgi:hypothetical protein
MDNAILKRLERLERFEREARLWRFLCLALLAGVVVASVRAQMPPQDGGAEPMAGKSGNFDRVTAQNAVFGSITVQGSIQIIGDGADPTSGPSMSLSNVQFTMSNGNSAASIATGGAIPRFTARRGNSKMIMSASDTSGEMLGTDSSGQMIMQFPQPKPASPEPEAPHHD